MRARLSRVLWGGRKATRVLRLLLLLLLALVAVEYVYGIMLLASPLKTNIYTPLYNAIQPSVRIVKLVAAGLPIKSIHFHKNITLYQNMTGSNLNKSSTVFRQTPIVLKSPRTVQRKVRHSTSTILSRAVTNKDDDTRAPTSDFMTENEPSPVNQPLCEIPTDLGPIEANKTFVELNVLEHQFSEVQQGGRYSPPNCTARHKVAIVVPYRDRMGHLTVFLNHMHPFLMKQQIEYGIFIIEQSGDKEFNRAKLMNVGFVEGQRFATGVWECFIFHDVDLLPLDTRNLYSCPRQPRHMSVAVDTFDFKLIYPELFGGVSAMTLQQFTDVNGFSNNYWGWGAEDDSMFARLTKMNYTVARYPFSIARYAMLYHKKSDPNPYRHHLLMQTDEQLLEDGLSTLQYDLLSVTQYHLYTHIVVDIDVYERRKITTNFKKRQFFIF